MKPTKVGIYRITLGITTYRWLCKAHVTKRQAAEWTCERTGDVEYDCDDCVHEQREAEGTA